MHYINLYTAHYMALHHGLHALQMIYIHDCMQITWAFTYSITEQFTKCMTLNYTHIFDISQYIRCSLHNFTDVLHLITYTLKPMQKTAELSYSDHLRLFRGEFILPTSFPP